MQFRDIRKVGVIGGGVTGFGIAVNFAVSGYSTVLCDVSDSIIEEARKRIHSAIQLFVEEDLIEKERAVEIIDRITFTAKLSKVAAEADFVTEAINERADSKKTLFETLDRMCPPYTIIASNTSSLLLKDFARNVKRQAKIIYTHYFVPTHIVPGVEVAKGSETSEETFSLTCNLMEKIGKVPLKVLKEIPGLMLNRIQGAMRIEALRMLAEGVASVQDIELGIISTFGFRSPHQSPLLHSDLAGIWRWPEEVKLKVQLAGSEHLAPELVQKMEDIVRPSKPWLIETDKIDEAIFKRDREFVRRLKTLYRSKRESGNI